MNIVLFGFKGCGKSTLGKQAAKNLGRAFIDTDHLIEDIYQISQNRRRCCRDIFHEVGAERFRALEQEAILSLQDVQHSVIAVGGGAMLSFENVEALNQSGKLFLLLQDKEVLRKRIFSESALPSYFDPKNPHASFERLFEEISDHYLKIGSAIPIDLTELSEKKAVEKICSYLKDGNGK